MSIILDALKRSDRERRLQKPPDLSQIYQENHSSRKKSPPFVLLLIAAVLIAGLSGAYLLLQKDAGDEKKKDSEKSALNAEKKKASSQSPKPLRQFAGKTGQNGTVQKQNSPTNVPSKSQTSFPIGIRPKSQEEDRSMDRQTGQNDSEGSAAANPLADILARAAQARQDMPASNQRDGSGRTNPLAALFSNVNRIEKEPTTPAATDASPPKPAPAQSVKKAPAAEKEPATPPPAPSVASANEPKAPVVEAPEPVSENTPQEEEIKEAAPPPSIEPEKESAAVVPETGKITLVDDMPYETRQKYEELKINVHIYDEKPEERRVFINMHSYKEGEKIEEGGPLLVAIIPAGIIVDYGEGKVQMNVKK